MSQLLGSCQAIFRTKRQHILNNNKKKILKIKYRHNKSGFNINAKQNVLKAGKKYSYMISASVPTLP